MVSLAHMVSRGPGPLLGTYLPVKECLLEKTGNMKDPGVSQVENLVMPRRTRLSAALTEAPGKKNLSFYSAQNKYNKKEMPKCEGNAEEFGVKLP